MADAEDLKSNATSDVLGDTQRDARLILRVGQKDLELGHPRSFFLMQRGYR